ncbi:MAG: ribonuclease P protein component [Anaerolineaceae bacterium]
MERARRLRKGTEFDTAYSKGTVVGSSLFAVRYVRNGTMETRWGFAVGKRIARKAVDRNRAKRRIREFARGLGVVQGFDIVVVARAPSLVASTPELRDGLRRVLERARLLEEQG